MPKFINDLGDLGKCFKVIHIPTWSKPLCCTSMLWVWWLSFICCQVIVLTQNFINDLCDLVKCFKVIYIRTWSTPLCCTSMLWVWRRIFNLLLSYCVNAEKTDGRTPSIFMFPHDSGCHKVIISCCANFRAKWHQFWYENVIYWQKKDGQKAFLYPTPTPTRGQWRDLQCQDDSASFWTNIS